MGMYKCWKTFLLQYSLRDKEVRVVFVAEITMFCEFLESLRNPSLYLYFTVQILSGLYKMNQLDIFTIVWWL